MTDCQCTQYVANHFGIGGYPNAKDWSGGYLQNNGFQKVDVQVGAIAVMQPSFPYVDQTYGHVGIVEQIEGNDILVRGANQWVGTTPFSENGCDNVRLTKFGPINRGDISFWLPDGGLDGKDPKDKHCDTDAYTVEKGTAEIKDDSGKVIGKVELRYSPRCKTNWCRVTSLIGAASLAGNVKRQSDNFTCEYKLDNTTLMYTNMVTAPHVKAQAYGNVNGHSAYTEWI